MDQWDELVAQANGPSAPPPSQGGGWDDLVAQATNAPATADPWDELSKIAGVSGHASELAKHRWATLRAATDANTFPTPQGNQPYQGGANLLGDLNRPVNQGTPGAIPNLPTLAPVAPGEAPPLERFARNANIGAVNLAGNTANFFINLANHPIDSANELSKAGLAVGKAGLWAAAKAFSPGSEQVLANNNIGPDEFNDMFMNDPVGTTTMVLGTAGGIAHGIVGPGEAPVVEPTSGTPAPPRKMLPAPEVPQPAAPSTPFEQAYDSLKQQMAEGGTPGQAAIRTIGEPAPLNPDEPVWRPSNRSTQGGGIQSVQAAQAEYQLVRPDLTKKQIKAAWTKDPDAVLREIALARAKDAVANTQQGFASEDIPGQLEAQTAAGVGSDPTVPINRPLDAFDNSRLQDMRNASQTVDTFHQNRLAQAAVKDVAPVVASGDFLPGEPSATGSAGSSRALGIEPPSGVDSGMRTSSTASTSRRMMGDMGGLFADLIGKGLKNDAFSQAELVEGFKERLNQIVDGLHQLKDTHAGFAPAMNFVRRVAPQMYDHFVGHIVAPGFARVRHIAYVRGLVKDVLGDGLDLKDKASTPEIMARLDFFGKIIMDDQSKSVDMKNQTITQAQRDFKTAKATGDKAAQAAARARLESLGATPDTVLVTNKLPKMTPAELAAEAANPMWQKAVQYHIDNLQADLESHAPAAGVQSMLYGPRGTYISLKRYEDIQSAPAGANLHEAPAQTAGPSGPFDYVHSRTSAAKGRTGAIPQGKFVTMDYVEHALDSRTRRYQSAYQRDMQQGMMDSDLTKSDGSWPTTTTLGGRMVKVVPLTLIDLDSGLEFKRVKVAKPLADAYRLVVDKPYNERYVLAQIVDNAATKALVAMPAEGYNHATNMLAVLAAADRVGSHRGAAGALLQWVPVIGKVGLAIDRIVNASKGQHLADNMDTLASKGGLRTSSFDPNNEMGTAEGVAKNATSGGSLNPKQWLFGYPRRGVPALDSKLKSATLDIVREGEPGISDTDAIHRTNAISGTYTTKLAPMAAKILGDTYPFARATTALARTGLQVATGFDPSTGRWSAKGFMQNVALPALTMALICKKLDDRGRWPIEHPGHQTGDGQFTHNGTTYTIPFRMYMQPIYRALTATGIRAGISKYIEDEQENAFKRIPSMTTAEDVGVATARGIGNYWRNLISPWIKSLRTLTTGKILYQYDNGDFMKAEDLDPNHPLLARLEGAFQSGFAPYSKFEEKGGNNFQTATGRAVNYGLGLLGTGIKADPASKEDAIMAGQNAAYKDKVDAAIGQILSTAKSKQPEEQGAYITKEIARRFHGQGLIVIHGKPQPVEVYATTESIRRNIPHKQTIPPEAQRNMRQAQ